MLLRVERRIRGHLKSSLAKSHAPFLRDLEAYLLQAVNGAESCQLPASLHHVVGGPVLTTERGVIVVLPNGRLRLLAIAIAQFHGVLPVYETLQDIEVEFRLTAASTRPSGSEQVPSIVTLVP